MRGNRKGLVSGQAATEYLVAAAAMLLALLVIAPDGAGGIVEAIASRYASLTYAVSAP